jgi:acetylornithine/succinyldiaminopimelate/putrescine aminotransferase
MQSNVCAEIRRHLGVFVKEQQPALLSMVLLALLSALRVYSVPERHVSCCLRPSQPYRVFNTWMGDPSKLLLLQGVLEVVRRDSLLDLVRKSGEKLLAGLRSFEQEFPHLLHSARGRGTFLSVTCSSARLRDDFVARLKKKGKLIV